MNPHRYCVVLCGGAGSRFWPVSRVGMPKQFLDFFGTGSSLLQSTVERVLPLVGADNVVVVANAAYGDIIREQLPFVKPENILLEPARRNTAPSVCWAAHHIHAMDPEASILTLPSDQLVLKEMAFLEALEQGFRFVEGGDRLLTMGIKPTFPATAYGYIQRGKGVDGFTGICRVKSFTEKPNQEMAKVFMATNEFFWNAGMFLWRADSIIRAFEKNDPDTAAVFARASELYGTSGEGDYINRHYPNTPSISIDYAILEKTDNVFVEIADLGWSDIGSWSSLYDCSPHGQDGNVSQNCRTLLRNCHNSVFAVQGDKIIVASGLDNYVVADNGNALLIYPIAEEQQIRQVVNEVKSLFGENYV